MQEPWIEAELEALTGKDPVGALLLTIPGCGKSGAWSIRAYTDDIKRFSSTKKQAAYAGLAPWVQNSNETVHHGKIRKRGPEELRTAVVLGMRRMKKETLSWRVMERYEGMKAAQGTGKLVIAAARKVSGIIWTMLTRQAGFKESRMTNQLTPLQSTKLDPQNFLMQEYISKLNKAPAGWGWR